tara:strand:+ start:2205 stop:2462 length:258 start_codon:yes stop_codon:yes gene_type:complete
MNRTEQNLEIALEKIKELTLENKTLEGTILLLHQQINKLEQPTISIKPDNSQNIDHILKEADQAMKRYTNKLRKEGLKYAKQKQS